MPVIINEIIIRTNIEKGESPDTQNGPSAMDDKRFEDIVQQAVQQVLEIIEEKKQR